MMSRRIHTARPGLSLLEVLVSMSIFLLSLIGIGQLITLSGDVARDVQQQGMAAQMAQSKMAEVLAGAVPLSSANDTPFDDDPDWQWSMDAAADSVAGIYRVTVRVFRSRPDGSTVESKLSQFVLDPSIRGSAMDSASSSTATSTDPNSTGGTTGSSSTGGTSGTSGTSSTSSTSSVTSGPGGTTTSTTTTAPASSSTSSRASSGGKQ